MRLIYFSNSYGPHDYRFLASLAKSGHRVFYLRLAEEKQVTDSRPVPEGIQQVDWAGNGGRFSLGHVPALTQHLRRVIRDINPSLIHAGPIQTCAFLSALTRFRPLLTMSWGFDLMQDADRSAASRWITSFTLRRSSFFVSDAQVTRDRAVAFGMLASRTLVFPWGVDLQEFSPAKPTVHLKSRSAVGKKPSRRGESLPRHAGGDSLVLFCNRSWEPRYGVDVLALAFARAVKLYPKLRLILVGAGSEGPALRRVLSDPEVSPHVQFVGRLPYADLPRLYRSADIFVSPSHVDGSSVSLMEALACGLPALVSDIPANREWVRENIEGWLFRDGDATELARKILDLASSRGRFTPQRKAARATAEAKADWNSNFGRLLEAYERTVHQN